MKKIRIFIAFASLLFTSVESRGQDFTAIKKEISNDNVLYFNLFEQKDTTIVNLYTDDGSLLPPNSKVIHGRAALSKDFADTYAGGKIKAVMFSTMDIYGDGILFVTEQGTWKVYGTKDQVLDHGNYLKIWKKTKNGWKIFRDIFNSEEKG